MPVLHLDGVISIIVDSNSFKLCHGDEDLELLLLQRAQVSLVVGANLKLE